MSNWDFIPFALGKLQWSYLILKALVDPSKDQRKVEHGLERGQEEKQGDSWKATGVTRCERIWSAPVNHPGSVPCRSSHSQLFLTTLGSLAPPPPFRELPRCPEPGLLSPAPVHPP